MQERHNLAELKILRRKASKLAMELQKANRLNADQQLLIILLTGKDRAEVNRLIKYGALYKKKYFDLRRYMRDNVMTVFNR